MKRRIPIALLAAAVFAGSAQGSRAVRDVTGGTAIPIQQAPWTAYINQGPGGSSCTGAIIDSLHVVTDAHCVYDSIGALKSPVDLQVDVGVSNDLNAASATGNKAEQDMSVSSIRVHPNYVWRDASTDDDIAVLTLAAPLDLTGSAVKAVALPASGAPYPAGVSAVFAGYGREVAGATPDGSLDEIALTVDVRGDCGGYAGSNVVVPFEDAIAFCAVSPSGATCSGDSGAGLVTTAGTPTLIGLAEGGPATCAPGSHGIFTYVGAPEILSFIKGDNQPSTAPRESFAKPVTISWLPPLVVGGTLKCVPGRWLGGQPTTLTYAFANAKTGVVLKRGSSPTFVAAAADLNDTIKCTVSATNVGGTSVQTSGASHTIGPAPKSATKHHS